MSFSTSRPRIDGEFYWDGGILSNTPTEVIFDDIPRRNSLIFAVHLWNPEGPCHNQSGKFSIVTRTFNARAASQATSPGSNSFNHSAIGSLACTCAPSTSNIKAAANTHFVVGADRKLPPMPVRPCWRIAVRGRSSRTLGAAALIPSVVIEPKQILRYGLPPISGFIHGCKAASTGWLRRGLMESLHRLAWLRCRLAATGPARRAGGHGWGAARARAGRMRAEQGRWKNSRHCSFMENRLR
jgi:hypothetical protein